MAHGVAPALPAFKLYGVVDDMELLLENLAYLIEDDVGSADLHVVNLDMGAH